jgi:isoaspartyl peptidase/L-asparaginase-like protein (Ntn-hydrolase superfamily)
VDAEVGAAITTGVGEEMIRIAGSHTIVLAYAARTDAAGSM